jgi:hypothetical protein
VLPHLAGTPSLTPFGLFLLRTIFAIQGTHRCIVDTIRDTHHTQNVERHFTINFIKLLSHRYSFKIPQVERLLASDIYLLLLKVALKHLASLSSSLSL